MKNKIENLYNEITFELYVGGLIDKVLDFEVICDKNELDVYGYTIIDTETREAEKIFINELAFYDIEDKKECEREIVITIVHEIAHQNVSKQTMKHTKNFYKEFTKLFNHLIFKGVI